MKTGFALVALVLTAAAQELPLPPGAVMAVQIDRPAAMLARAAELKIPGLPVRESGKLSSIAYATYPGDKTVIVFDAESPAALDRIEPLVQWIARKRYTVRMGNRLVVAPSAEFVRPGLVSSPLYLQAKKAASADAAAWAFVNMAMLNQYPPAQKKLAASGSWLEILLSGAIKESLRSAHWLSVSLRVDGRNLSLHTASDGKLDPAGAGAFSQPGDTGILPNLSVPGQLAAISLWRDLGKFYAARETLFPEKTSAAILFENFMEIFFTGRDLNAEVFARIQPQIRLVVARQQYDPRVGTPAQQYPAAALVVRVDQAEEFGEMLEEAWQKAIGLQNFTRGQQALPGLMFDRTAHGGVPFTYCYYSARNEKDRERLPARFNVRPALARMGPYMILSSTDALAADVIDALNREDGRVPAARSTVRSLVEISSGSEIASILKTNRDEMVRQGVMGSGKKPREAEAEFDRNVALLGMIAGARLSFSVGSADLELRLK
jgi:hypothetical protein